MGLLSEDRKSEGLALGLSVADNLTLTRLEPFGPAGAVCPRAADRRRRTLDLAARDQVRGPGAAGRRAVGRQPAEGRAARLLHHDVDVLVLDEPTRGIDVGSKAQIYRLIDALVG